MYQLVLLPLLLVCGLKLQFIEAKAQMEYPGIQSAAITLNFEAKILNPKEKEITITELWYQDHWYTVKSFKSKDKTVTFKQSFVIPKNHRVTKQTTDKGEAAVIRYKIKNKIKEIGINKVDVVEPIARP